MNERLSETIFAHPSYKDRAVYSDCVVQDLTQMLAVTCATRIVDAAHCCQIPPGLLGQFSQKNSAAGEKIRPQAATPKSSEKVQ